MPLPPNSYPDLRKGQTYGGEGRRMEREKFGDRNSSFISRNIFMKQTTLSSRNVNNAARPNHAVA